MEQIGISPKVKVPAGLLSLIGIIIAVIGALTDDNTLATVGLSVLGSAGIGAGAGYAAPPGDVLPLDDPAAFEPNDDQIDLEELPGPGAPPIETEGTD